MNFFNQLVGNSIKVNVVLRHTALYPGNVVEGYVELVVSSPTTFRAIRVRACGKELVHVERKIRERIQTPPGEPPQYRERTEIHESRQAVHNQLTTLVGSMKTNPIGYESVLPVGTFHYPFAFQLPKNAPPSFSKKITDDYAEIVYYIKAYVDVPMGRDAMSRTFFNVIRPMPISQHAAANPFNFANQYDITCCICVNKGKIMMRLFMDRTIIALDRDSLRVFCEIDNTHGEEPVEALNVSLTNHISYKAQGMTETHSLDAGTQALQNQKILPGAQGQLSGTITLNRNSLTTIKTDNVSSRYTLTASVQIPWATDPEQTIPVIVGQTVDESNWSEPMRFEEVPVRLLPKHHHSSPETFYQPPPQPVFRYNPPQQVAVPQYQPAAYDFQMPPYGAPNQNWQSSTIQVQGQVYQPPPTQTVWLQGFNGPAV